MCPFIGITVLHPRSPSWPPLPLPLPGVPVTHKGLKSQADIPELQRHRGGSRPGFMACWWAVKGGAAEGGQEGDRVCFKGEEELVVALLNARWWIPMKSPGFPLCASDSWAAHSLVHTVSQSAQFNFDLDFFFPPTYLTRSWRFISAESPPSVSRALTDTENYYRGDLSVSFFIIAKVTLHRLPFYCTCMKYPACSLNAKPFQQVEPSEITT